MNLLIGAGVLVVGYLLYTKNKSNSITNDGLGTSKQSIRLEEKIDLFNQAIQQPYRGGAYNPRLEQMI